MSRAHASVFAAALLTFATAGSATASLPPPLTSSRAPEHVVVMVFENHEADAILTPRSPAPYFRSLARTSVALDRLYAITHPSLPNYLALTSGSTHDIHSDCADCFVDGTNIVDQLEGAGISWKAYMESMPGSCSTTVAVGRYVMKHDPFMYYTDIRTDVDRCNAVVPWGQLTTDLQGGSLPTFAWITPNLCHDMHDCPITVGDRFLRAWVPRIVPALGSNGILIVLFDEGITADGCCRQVAAGGHISGIITGPGARIGISIRIKISQYSVLKLIEDALGLDALGMAATAPMIDGWQAGA